MNSSSWMKARAIPPTRIVFIFINLEGYWTTDFRLIYLNQVFNYKFSLRFMRKRCLLSLG